MSYRERTLVSTDPNGRNDKSAAATFVADGDGVRALNTPDTMGALAATRISTKDIREKVDEFIDGMVQDRLDVLRASDVVAAQFERRIEVALKTAMPRIEREIEAAAKAAVLARVHAAVEAMNITVLVSVQPKG